MKTAYIAESWFNPDQLQFKNQACALLKQNQTLDWLHCYQPADHQYKNWTLKTHPDLLANPEWQMATFQSDLAGIHATDLMIALYDPQVANADPGVVWELGYAYALHKPMILVLPDQPQNDLNLMPALGATAVISIKDLPDFDFNLLNLRPFSGQVY